MMWTVDDFAVKIRQKVGELRDVDVLGVVGRVTRASSGHAYFELVGAKGARLGCVAWSSSGLDVYEGEARVRIRTVDFYPPQGRCQAVVCGFESTGVDAPSPSARLLDVLRREGALDRPRRSPPDLIAHLCIVTSSGSAAHADMLEGVRTRWPGLRTTVIHTLVQGEHAPKAIAHALGRANALTPDVIVCGRGGGSAGDLEAFDTEPVARALLALDVPVVSAVGHESDHSIADAVADVRAKTPTAAIELLLHTTKRERHETLATLHRRACDAARSAVSRANDRLSAAERRVRTFRRTWIGRAHARHAELRFRALEGARRVAERASTRRCFLRERVATSTSAALRRHAERLALLGLKAERVSPRAILKRGFALMRREDRMLRGTASLDVGDQITIEADDGNVDVVVLRKRCRT